MVGSGTSQSERTIHDVKMAQKKTETRNKRTVLLRATLILSLIAATAICSSLAYVQLLSSERNVGLETYRSIASSATRGAQAITERKYQGSEVMVTMMSQVLPNSSDWPMITMDGYIPISQAVAALSATYAQAIAVIVEPEEVEALENHAKEVYKAQNRPNGTGYSDFGFGIWQTDTSENKIYPDGRVHETTVKEDAVGRRKILTPLFMHNNAGSGSLLYNPYGTAARAPYLDSGMDCIEASTTNRRCGAFTDIVELVTRPGPAALLYLPISPANDPANPVGFALSSVHWEEVLTNVVPDYVDGLTCVISTKTTSYTFEIQNGKPELIGKGDLHDRTYTEYGQSVLLNQIETADISEAYTLTVYPSTRMLDAFTTKSPTTVALGFAGVIAVVACIFFGYDYLMRREAEQRKAILEMKRRFVRFISHEIRTPLNTVCMGLELLQSELKSPPGLSGVPKTTEEDIGFLLSVTEDTNENAHVAVEILNDLLNYDKLETGTMELEVTPVLIWDLVEKTIRQFGIQAVNRGVELKLNIDQPAVKGFDIEEGKDSVHPYNVFGDRVRLSQVIRNVISNALKFTPPSGTIDVTATYIPNGLSNAKHMLEPGAEGVMRVRTGSIKLSVKDSGVGLSRDQIDRLFNEGVQFDANRLQHGGGSGLGLNIAKGLVEQHCGTIVAESDGVGHGTTFHIELPLYVFDEDELREVLWDDKDSETEPTETAGGTTGSDFSGPEGAVGKSPPTSRRVLVAEDSASSRKMLMRLLERAGHECIPAADGKQAVDVIKEDMEISKADATHVPIDSILMDYEMPILRGPEACAVVRRRGYAGIIVGVTGNVLSEDMEFFLKQGADKVLPKPVSLKEIQAYWREHERRFGASKGK